MFMNKTCLQERIHICSFRYLKLLHSLNFIERKFTNKCGNHIKDCRLEYDINIIVHCSFSEFISSRKLMEETKNHSYSDVYVEQI